MDDDGERAAPRERIVAAALELLDTEGAAAVTTRAVTARANVQAPAIYRFFGDMKGLLDEAAELGFAEWVATKGARPQADDPVEELRRGWDQTISFGLEHPALYGVVYANPADSPSVVRGHALLEAKIDRVARAGRLRVSRAHALALMRSTGHGVTLALIAMPADERDLGLSVLARESVISAITTATSPEPSDVALVTAAVTLQSLAGDATVLRPAERTLLNDWLERIIAAAP